MGFFNKGKFSGRASHTGTGSQPTDRADSGSPGKILYEGPRAADKSSSAQHTSNLIETKTDERNKLELEPVQQISILDESLRPADTPRLIKEHQNSELQSNSQEVSPLKSDSHEQDRKHRERIEIEQRKIKSQQRLYQTQFDLQQTQHAAALQKVQDQLHEERKQSAQARAYLEDQLEAQLTQERRRFEAQIRAEKDEAQSQAHQIAERLREQLDQKRQRIYELDVQIQTQTETIARTAATLNTIEGELNEEKRKFQTQTETIARTKQTIKTLRSELSEVKRNFQAQAEVIEQKIVTLNRKTSELNEERQKVRTQAETIQQITLTLNRTRNELSEEKRKASKASKDSTMKSQMLEFVQQQCAILQESLRDRIEEPVLGAGGDEGNLGADNTNSGIEI